ncbi:MAG: hypothetical protein KDA31_14665 [Phycisphaerales bacterium]|nr:hypothetical protein [Phycisphaerales bacterium]MCB9836057.1 hypothetical protein [Phycisphaera sp.]
MGFILRNLGRLLILLGVLWLIFLLGVAGFVWVARTLIEDKPPQNQHHWWSPSDQEVKRTKVSPSDYAFASICGLIPIAGGGILVGTNPKTRH